MKLGFSLIYTKLCEGSLRWFGHVQRKGSDASVRRVETITIDGKRSRGRFMKT